MSAFTFTAPVVTLEDEEAEREALSEAERRQIHKDLYGQVADDDDDNDGEDVDDKVSIERNGMIASKLLLLQETINQLPEREQIHYMEAVSRAPELIQSESNPVVFLNHTNFDVNATARQLVDYWKYRKDIFGPDRCYLPMTLTGAMVEDVEVLYKAFIFEVAPDHHGRTVMYIDRMRCTSEVAHRDSICRCFWYAVHTLAQRETVRRLGYVWLVNFRGYDLYKHFDRIMTKKMLWAVRCHPVDIKAAHFCRGPGSSVSDIVLPVLKKMFDKYLRLRMCIHCGSTSDLLHEMEDYGLAKEHVNCFFDGLVTNGAVARRWLDECRLLESSAVATNIHTEIEPPNK